MNKWENKNRTYFICEVGANHCGSIDIAMEMVRKAKESGADCIKIQKRDMESLSEYSDNKIYDNENSFGHTYTEHRKALELSMEDIIKLRDYAKSLGLDFAASCWDKKSLDDMQPHIDFLKIQSADSHNFEFLEYAFKKYKKIIISIGGTKYEDVQKIVELATNNNCVLAILHCTPIYPLDFQNVNLNNITTLIKTFPNNTIGYSGHEKGIAVSTAAVALGARIIERHFTLDRSMRGGDQAASLEPKGFSKMVRDIRVIEQALGSYEKVKYEDEQKKLDSLNLTRKSFEWRASQ